MNYPKHTNIKTETQTKLVDIAFPLQEQDETPGIESIMEPKPIFDNPNYKGSGKLTNKVAIITGGDSGIGRSVAVYFAKEGASVAIVYFNERSDAEDTKAYIENLGQKCLLIEGDLKDESFCIDAVNKTVQTFGQLDILVNNAATQFVQQSILDITKEQLYYTFETNFFSYFYMTKAALEHLKAGSSIINTTSVTAYEGNKTLIDYSATKGAITTFTRSLAKNLAEKEIRVNNVAPGPIWTPLIVSSFSPDKSQSFGVSTPLKRAGQPFEVAPAFVYLASDDSRYVTGQTIHVNGGLMVCS